MSDLIDRQEAIEALEKYSEHAAIYIVKGVPAAQPERMKGNWVCIDGTNTECDQCGFVLEDWTQGLFYNFCPNCGADMREGEE